MRFSLHEGALDPRQLLESLRRADCGGYVAFEGAVRNHNDGRRVLRLEYEAFEPLALREGERILADACARFGLQQAACAHRIGALAISDIAVWVGVGAPHRGEAFEACRYIIDHIKHTVPIWKKEYYEDGDSGWVNCENCAAVPGAHAPAAAGGAPRAHYHHD
jgi:molybdopterin synthase catalytic subunit